MGARTIGGKSTEIEYVYKESTIPYFLRFFKVFYTRSCPCQSLIYALIFLGLIDFHYSTMEIIPIDKNIIEVIPFHY
jgi:hypothetical protein